MLRQDEIDNCGEIVTRNILRLLLKRKEAYFYKIGKKSDTFYDIEENLKSYDIESTGYEYIALKDLKKVKTPFVLRVREEDKYHFVIVLKIIGLVFLIHDPNGGYKCVSEKRIEKISTREILTFKVIKSIKRNRFNILKTKEKVTLGIINILEFLTLISLISVKFIKYQLVVSFVNLALGAIFIVIHKSYLLTISRRLDLRVVLPYIKSNKSEEDYLKINRFKVNYLKEVNDKISSVFLFLAYFIYALFLDIKTLSFLLFLTAFITILKMILNSLKSSKNSEIFELERSFLKSEMRSEDEYKNLVKSSSKISLLIVSFNLVIYMVVFGFFALYQHEDFDVIKIIINGFFYMYLFDLTESFMRRFMTNNSSLMALRTLNDNIYTFLVEN